MNVKPKVTNSQKRTSLNLRSGKIFLVSNDNIINQNQNIKHSNDKNKSNLSTALKNLSISKMRSISIRSSNDSLNSSINIAKPEEFNEMRDTIKNQATRISSIENDIKSKESNFNSTIDRLNAEIKELKSLNLFLITQVRVGNFNNINVKSDFGFYRMADKNCFNDQIDSFAKASKFCIFNETDFKLSVRANNESTSPNIVVHLENLVKQQNAQISQLKTDVDAISKLVSNIEGDLISMSTYIKKVELMNLESNIAWKKMNQQLHVLSAKFISFNAKINDFFQTNKSSNKSNANNNTIIDDDAKEFFNEKKENNSKNNHSNQVNSFTSSNAITHRIIGEVDRYGYTSRIKVNVVDSSIVNLNSFRYEFETMINNIIGKNIVKNTNIIKYTMKNQQVSNVSLYLDFNVPLSYDYINAFRFPSNWFFFIGKNQMCTR